ncbi:MAG: hypothetical protein GTN38_01930 [Candidatus Aenigmarchaeota archaeon]|nr:hypothetical protein [Candidatus Aenigmarchaeota archaeon]NIP40314.1 hypothetical protein [Candidatus Aenigmarchaeota archaeon]NIQ17807.1 hypothetical protein [Candidatus Aenigmarchaeota archaeon]NIS73189.1 hypothetical protein [Candidatus Aenigmarchaeota archaeon]
MKFLKIDFRHGFNVYSNGIGPVWVCPHSGPALEIPTSRDENTDTVAALCWLKTGGSLIISGIPRKRMLGVDFNRDIPPEDLSLLLWPKFIENGQSERLKRYRKKYGWVAQSKTDHHHRLRIYKDFWRTVKRLGNVIVFVHREYTRMKNFPSIMDVVTYQGEGVNKDIIKKIVKNINKKYEPLFKRISRNYKDSILLEEKRVVDRIKDIFSEFDLEKIKIEYKENILDDIKVMKKYADKEAVKKLKKEFNERNFISGIRSALRKGPHPRITVESVFKGEMAIRTKKPLFVKENIVMEVECNSFINYWYPEMTSNILMDLLKNLVSVDRYKKLGIKQTHILKFIGK